MAATALEKERMLEAETLNVQLEGIERRLQSLARSRVQARELLTTLDTLPTVVEGDEILVPIATGLFVRAKAGPGGSLFVNVGDGVTVEKSVTDVRAMVSAQIEQIMAQEEEGQRRFESALARMGELQQAFEPKIE